MTPQIGLVQGLGHGFFAEAPLSKEIAKAALEYSRDPTAQLQAHVRDQYSEQTALSLDYTGRPKASSCV